MKDNKISQSASLQQHQYVREEVLTTREQIDERHENLYKAMVLGNSYNRRVRLTCHTTDGKQEMTGKVWAITNHHISLEGSVSIPIKAIESVEIF